MDIEPQELIERLNEGKIYREAQARQALNHFFSVENLTALREIALRRCADRVNRMAESVKVQNNSGLPFVFPYQSEDYSGGGKNGTGFSW